MKFWETSEQYKDRQPTPYSNKIKHNIKKGEKLNLLVNKMNDEPTAKNLLNARNKGLEFREVINNRWEKVTTYLNDFENYRYILVHREFNFEPYAIGRYKKNN